MNAPEGWVWLARVKRTQGRKGEVFAEILTDFPEKFNERRRLWLLRSGAPEAEVRVVDLLRHWMHKGGVVLHFAGVDSISAAEKLTGDIVAIPLSERANLDGGAVYISDLVGCELVDVAGREPVLVGEIEDVDRSAGPVVMLIVRPLRQRPGESANRPANEGEILIPFAKDYLRRLDVAAKRVEMALPEGLVDLNRVERS